MLEKTVEFQTVDGEDASITFKNTMRHDVRDAVMRDRFVDDAMPDRGYRDHFCVFASRIAAVKGLDGWQPVDETATQEEFTACYLSFTEHVDFDTFYALVDAINDLKAPVADAVEKPEDALTAEEKADPN